MIKKAWTVYVVLLTAAIVVGEVANVMQGGAVNFRSMANWIVTGALLIATWGYALQKPIGAQHYWRTACWVVIGATLVTTVPAALAGPEAIIMVAVLLVLVLPAFYASYRYAYRSPQLWRAEERVP